MSRKKFIESCGATCSNWNWSWSFINKEKKQIIFGVWTINIEDIYWKIFSSTWIKNEKGQKSKGFNQSKEHIRLIEEENYELYVFKMFHDSNNKTEIIKISKFEANLIQKRLMKKEDSWYAVDINELSLAEEIFDNENRFFEGAKETVTVNKYERNLDARNRCIEIHGYFCKVCGFDFEKFYGTYGAKYIHVHHLIPLYEIQKEYKVCPEKDLIPVCANCHAMIHRGRGTISIEELKAHINKEYNIFFSPVPIVLDGNTH
ncbi:putative type IV methyl-directed restriction system, component McrB [Arcobacter venerupis]|uniref:Type IV methyl-directed restriction system, component McrB n=1 Tax=Arcobacter venerupis TaxID=1054033 RepID=A0AAE7B6P6_9BACT|nr:HNH endonuclease [Arcobacter venerupis]QKF66378.1 putative type IV methyl-directed restriction system, component McrB [Arcobacter venerupis]RWS50845.1 hypothetical protein CKA56_00460 [Arcobacter venerupis]